MISAYMPRSGAKKSFWWWHSINKQYSSVGFNNVWLSFAIHKEKNIPRSRKTFSRIYIHNRKSFLIAKVVSNPPPCVMNSLLSDVEYSLLWKCVKMSIIISIWFINLIILNFDSYHALIYSCHTFNFVVNEFDVYLVSNDTVEFCLGQT